LIAINDDYRLLVHPKLKDYNPAAVIRRIPLVFPFFQRERSIKPSSYPKKNNFILRCNGSPNTVQGSGIPDKNRSPGFPRLLFVLTNINLIIMVFQN